ncbi:MAG: hypothetical protein CMG00_03210 [Candidatus Marinimicrobia bacterium]|nr:hypothetical protein [Candidatus Neomarinimicrobiota bacterium]
MKKESTKIAFKGFTLMELLIGSIIATISCLAIIYGIAYIQTRSYEIRLKERAFEELKSYTELWKGKIAADNISEVLSNSKTVCLVKDIDNSALCLHNAVLNSTIVPIDVEESNAKRSGLKTSIQWESRAGATQKLDFYVEQMVF